MKAEDGGAVGLPPVPGLDDDALEILWRRISTHARYHGSWLEKYPAVARQVIGAPSNRVRLDEADGSLVAVGLNVRGKAVETDLLGLKETTGYRYFFRCPDCGYEQRDVPTPLRDRVGTRAEARAKSRESGGQTRYLCRVCISVAKIHPELVPFIRPDPATARLPDPLGIPATVSSIKVHMACSHPGCTAVSPCGVQWLAIKRLLPLCDQHREAVRHHQAPRFKAGEVSPDAAVIEAACRVLACGNSSELARAIGIPAQLIAKITSGSATLRTDHRYRILDQVAGLGRQCEVSALIKTMEQRIAGSGDARPLEDELDVPEFNSDDARLIDLFVRHQDIATRRDLADALGVRITSIAPLREGRSSLGPRSRLRILAAVKKSTAKKWVAALDSSKALASLLREQQTAGR